MPSSSLLLLPPAPTTVTYNSLSALYRPAITDAVTQLRKEPTSTELVLAVPIPHLQPQLDLPRAIIYDEAQHLLAGIYSLFCGVCASLIVDVEAGTPGSVDVRVVLLVNHQSKVPFSGGPIIDEDSFVAAKRRWNTIFSNHEDTHLLLSRLEGTDTHQDQVQLVSNGHQSATGKSHPPPTPRITAKEHYIVAVGGTFDHVHAGHKLLLTATALLLQPTTTTHRRLVVGITGDELLKNKKYVQYLGTWKQRQDDVVQFLLSVLLFEEPINEQYIKVIIFDDPVPNGKATHTHLVPYNLTIECVEIQDPFGPTITDESVTALIVSGETRSGGQAVNDERTKKGWKSLEVFEIDVLDSGEAADPSKTDNFASKISSTAIRKRIAESLGKPSL